MNKHKAKKLIKKFDLIDKTGSIDYNDYNNNNNNNDKNRASSSLSKKYNFGKT